MASFDPQEFGFDEPPPRPTTPPVRRGFLVVLSLLCLVASLVYGIPYVAERTGYAWESGRARAASEALVKLDNAGAVKRASELFRLATTAVAPAVVRIQSQRLQANRPGEAAGKGAAWKDDNLGSGFVIDREQGYIVTNRHVVRDADRIEVSLSHGATLPAKLVGADPKTDVAVLKVKGHLPVAAQWGDSDKLDVGDWVLAIGSPYALDMTVTAGIVSATQRNNLRINEYESYIQTDAAINPGNSGGPLIDLTGKVIGINTAIFTTNQSQGNEGIGLAIPASMAKQVVESLIKEGRVVRGYLGIGLAPINDAAVKNLGLPNARGVLVSEVRPESPASKAGLKEGDVIVKLAGREVSDPNVLRNLTATLTVGKSVPVAFYRAGTLKTLDVTIAEFPGLPVLISFGFHLREIPPGDDGGTAGMLEIDQVFPESQAAQTGLKAGMRVLFVGRTPVHTKTAFTAAVAALDPDSGLPLVLQTPDGQSGTVNIGAPAPQRR